GFVERTRRQEGSAQLDEHLVLASRQLGGRLGRCSRATGRRGVVEDHTGMAEPNLVTVVKHPGAEDPLAVHESPIARREVVDHPRCADVLDDGMCPRNRGIPLEGNGALWILPEYDAYLVQRDDTTALWAPHLQLRHRVNGI